MKTRQTVITLVFVVSLLLGNISIAHAFPPLPSSFYGAVKVDGANVPEGTPVTAWINGVQYAQALTTLYNGDSVYSLDVPGDDATTAAVEGGSSTSTVVFHVGDLAAPQTASWKSGTNESIDLDITTEFTLTVTSAHGTVTRTPDKPIYKLNDVVELKAVPETGWLFSSWSGGASGSSNPVSLKISGNTSVTANYTAQTFVISGNTGLSGVTLTYADGITKNVFSGSDGSYSIVVPYNWSGKVTPSLAGHTFVPANREYSAVTEDKPGQDYTPTAINLTLSGNTGLAGVTLSYTDGTAKTVVSGSNGAYSFTVPFNWSGSITPSKEGYTFTPTLRSFTNLQASFPNQDFTPTLLTFTISGNAGVPGVTLSYTDGLAKSVVSDSSGAYSLAVSYNWSGSVTPSKTDFKFTPLSRTYANVKANKSAQNFSAVSIIPPTFYFKLYLPLVNKVN
jgi:hypothetical protein